MLFSRHHYMAVLFLWGFYFFPTATVKSVDFLDTNIRIHGFLVADPCNLVMEDTSLVVDFGTIIDKYLYINNRTHPKEFKIRLSDCVLAPDQGVRIGFIGTENSNLPGFLALDSGSSANHIGVGIQDDRGNFLPINKLASYYPLHNGFNTLTFSSYIEAEYNAIVEKKIGLGTFTATAVFILDYD
ncbi:TPA: type 1 fimbrial protein [Proteus mirabilis]|nr:type 1 fimbrial protein [Proteus mirabilis]